MGRVNAHSPDILHTHARQILRFKKVPLVGSVEFCAHGELDVAPLSGPMMVVGLDGFLCGSGGFG